MALRSLLVLLLSSTSRVASLPRPRRGIKLPAKIRAASRPIRALLNQTDLKQTAVRLWLLTAALPQILSPTAPLPQDMRRPIAERHQTPWQLSLPTRAQALNAMQLSKEVYKTDTPVLGKFQSIIKTDTGTVVSIVRSYPWSWDDPRVTIVFKGSSAPTTPIGFKNWFGTNLQAWKVPMEKAPLWRRLPLLPIRKPVGLHKGYKQTYDKDNCEVELFDAIDALPANYKVVVTGHSLGGAMATVFAARYALQRPERMVRLITYGAPRVGTDQFREMTEFLPNLAIARFVHQGDPVPRFPNIGYKHVGHTIIIGGNETLVNPWGNENEKAHGEWNALKLISSAPIETLSFDKHQTASYLDALQVATHRDDWPLSVDATRDVGARIDQMIVPLALYKENKALDRLTEAVGYVDDGAQVFLKRSNQLKLLAFALASYLLQGVFWAFLVWIDEPNNPRKVMTSLRYLTSLGSRGRVEADPTQIPSNRRDYFRWVAQARGGAMFQDTDISGMFTWTKKPLLLLLQLYAPLVPIITYALLYELYIKSNLVLPAYAFVRRVANDPFTGFAILLCITGRFLHQFAEACDFLDFLHFDSSAKLCHSLAFAMAMLRGVFVVFDFGSNLRAYRALLSLRASQFKRFLSSLRVWVNLFIIAAHYFACKCIWILFHDLRDPKAGFTEALKGKLFNYEAEAQLLKNMKVNAIFALLILVWPTIYFGSLIKFRAVFGPGLRSHLPAGVMTLVPLMKLIYIIFRELY